MSDTPCPFCGQIHGTACDATTPANPTDQIATTPAVLSPETPIVPTTGTKRVPDDSEAAVVQDAQQYDWREDWNRVQTRIGYDEDAHVDAMHRLAAHFERLEAERDIACAILGAAVDVEILLDTDGSRSRLLVLRHNPKSFVWQDGVPDSWREFVKGRAAHDNAERVIRG